MNRKIINFCRLILVFLTISALYNCKSFRNNKIISSSDINIKIKRFDKDLFSIPFEDINDSVIVLRKKYPVFFELFNEYIINIGDSYSEGYNDFLLEFVTYYGSQKAYEKVNSDYFNFNGLNTTLSHAFRYYHYYFPDRIIPEVVTFIGGYQQSIVVDDSILAIGIDNYLGRDYELYKNLGIQHYVMINMLKEKIVPDCISSWLTTEFGYNDSINNVLSQMIYHGKIHYVTKEILPDTPDSLIIGFTSDQINFCKKNEKKMWTYLVEYKRLFSTDMLIINKLINEAPFTNDFTRESPGRAVVWVGWQIVNSYMKKNNVSIYELMNNNNYMNIFNNALYKP